MVKRMNKKRLAVYANSTVSTVGSVTLELKKYILGLFPPNFFKKVYIEGTLAENKLSEGDDFSKSENPKLAIQYTFEIDKTRNFGHFTMHSFVDGDLPIYVDSLPIIFENTKDNIFLRTSLTRFKILFDFKIAGNTNLQINNMYHWLMTKMNVGDKRFLPVVINTKISNDVIKLIQLRKGFTTYEELQDYLKTHNCIIERIKESASGNYIYVMYFHSNLLLDFQSLDKEKTDKTGKVENQGLVTFSIEASGNMPSVFYLDLSVPDNYIPEEVDLNSLMSPLYMEFSKFVPKENIEDGFTRLLHEKFISSIEDQDDILELEDIFMETEYQDVIRHALTNKKYVELEQMFRIKLYRDREDVPSDKYLFDYETLSLLTINSYKNYTYDFAIYKHNLNINNYIHQYFNFKPNDFLNRYK